MFSKLFSLDRLVLDWKTGQYNESSTYNYVIVFLFFQIFQSYSSKTNTASIETWLFLPVGLVAFFFVIGVFHLMWQANGGKDGKRFLDKWLSLTTVLMVTRALPFSILVVGVTLLPLALGTPEYLLGTSLAGLALMIGIIGYLLFRILKILKEIRQAELKILASQDPSIEHS